MLVILIRTVMMGIIFFSRIKLLMKIALQDKRQGRQNTEKQIYDHDGDT